MGGVTGSIARPEVFASTATHGFAGFYKLINLFLGEAVSSAGGTATISDEAGTDFISGRGRRGAGRIGVRTLFYLIVITVVLGKRRGKK